jgi:hypothetical protein
VPRREAACAEIRQAAAPEIGGPACRGCRSSPPMSPPLTNGASAQITLSRGPVNGGDDRRVLARSRGADPYSIAVCRRR